MKKTFLIRKVHNIFKQRVQRVVLCRTQRGRDFGAGASTKLLRSVPLASAWFRRQKCQVTRCLPLPHHQFLRAQHPRYHDVIVQPILKNIINPGLKLHTAFCCTLDFLHRCYPRIDVTDIDLFSSQNAPRENALHDWPQRLMQLNSEVYVGMKISSRLRSFAIFFASVIDYVLRMSKNCPPLALAGIRPQPVEERH